MVLNISYQLTYPFVIESKGSMILSTVYIRLLIDHEHKLVA